MKRLRQNLLLLIAGLTGAAIAAEAWWLQRARARAARAMIALVEKKHECEGLAGQTPAPTGANEKVLRAELAAAWGRIQTLRGRLHSPESEPRAGTIPSRPADAFFELANFVENARTQAGAVGMAVRPDERFGFSSHANEGPDAGLIGPVHRQLWAIQGLLKPLFESHPLALLAVRRELPGSAQTGRTGAEDFFTMDPALSLRQGGVVGTDPIRVEFSGQTSTLRDFLDGIAALAQPVVVRSVGVEPLPSAGEPSVDGISVPVVRQGFSKFVVTLEFILPTATPPRPTS